MTFNYRTNVFGFPESPDIPVQQNNLGLLDQELVFTWVQQNIAQFGGDKDQVTLMVRHILLQTNSANNGYTLTGAVSWLWGRRTSDPAARYRRALSRRYHALRRPALLIDSP